MHVPRETSAVVALKTWDFLFHVEQNEAKSDDQNARIVQMGAPAMIRSKQSGKNNRDRQPKGWRR
jgi:hypothetical protein